MAMYYYARKLQKAERKYKALQPTAISTVNGSNSTCSSNGSPICSSGPVVVSPEENPCTSNPSQPSHVHRGPSVAAAAAAVSPNDWDRALVYQDSNLVSGTLEALIQHLVPTESYYPDRAFIFAFLLSSRLFILPHELLGRVFRLAITTPTHSPKYSVTRATNVPNMVKLLGEWTELFPYDFRDELMMAHVRNITEKCVADCPQIRKEVSQLLTTLLARLTALEKYEDFLHRIHTEAALGEPQSSLTVKTICPDPTTLAQQLTHIELERLSHIGPEEFVQAFAKDNLRGESNYKEFKKTRNLESYVQWFNHLSYYVATEICKAVKKKTRVRLVEYWIEVAKECYHIGNFNSLMAIIAGLNMAPVARLKKTWSKVCTAQLATLEHQMDPSANFSSYRSTFKEAVWRSVAARDNGEKIVIPFFSLLVKDLYFLNEACATKLPNGYINFEKIWQFAKQVTEVLALQQITCSFPRVQNVLQTLNTSPVFSETALCLTSYEREAADNLQERERLKYLLKEEASSSEVSDSSPKKKHFKKSKKPVVATTTTAPTTAAGTSATSPIGGASSPSTSFAALAAAAAAAAAAVSVTPSIASSSTSSSTNNILPPSSISNSTLLMPVTESNAIENSSTTGENPLTFQCGNQVDNSPGNSS